MGCTLGPLEASMLGGETLGLKVKVKPINSWIPCETHPPPIVWSCRRSDSPLLAAEPFELLLPPSGTHFGKTSSVHQLYSRFSITRLKNFLFRRSFPDIVKVKVKVHTLDIAPLRSESPPQKRSGMARVFKGFHSFTCTPTRSSAIGMSHACLCLPSCGQYSFTDLGGMEGWLGLVLYYCTL